MRPVDQVLRDIQEFAPTDDGNWRRLDDLLDELWQFPLSQAALLVLFDVFERFPEEDGAGVLWSIVHGLEATSVDYSLELRRSMERQPSLMGEIMLDRLQRSTQA